MRRFLPASRAVAAGEARAADGTYLSHRLVLAAARQRLEQPIRRRAIRAVRRAAWQELPVLMAAAVRTYVEHADLARPDAPSSVALRV
jgi:hypothetical protein